MGSVKFDVEYLPAGEFFAAHPEVTAATDRSLLTDLLYEALGNKDVASRAVLANRLLDWGADPTQVRSGPYDALGVFVSRLEDPAVEAPLCRRLLESGADPNLQSGRHGLPLEELMYLPRFVDGDLVPVYDVWFAHPGLDFFVEDRTGDGLWDKVWRMRWVKPILVTRAVRYIEEHTGVLPPPARFRKKQPDKSWLRFCEGDVMEQDAAGWWRIAEVATGWEERLLADMAAGFPPPPRPESAG